jgi:hypothetical protein
MAWTQIITGVVGAIIVGMQTANLSETNTQTGLMRRIDTALEQQVALIAQVNQEGKRVDQALANQYQMIEAMETVLKNQNEALELLKNKP